MIRINSNITFRMTGFRKVLMFFSAMFFVLVAYRFAVGLSITNLSDAWPWGLWTVIDVKLGIALAAGGFTTAGIYYVLGIKKIESVVKPALLTAWLGYCMVALGLLVDLGRWYGFWHPIVSWGHHSVMFELYMCVLLYTVVLTAEFAPIFFDGIGFKRTAKFFVRLTGFLVIAGIVLSTMHQSSLGSMYVLMAGRLDRLWWTMALPILYFSSAVAVGPAVVTCESALSGKAYKHEWDNEAMPFLAKWSGYVLSFYFVARIVDLIVRDQFTRLFTTFDAQTFMCLLELIIGSVLPLLFFWSYNVSGKFMDKRMAVRNAIFIILGVVLNRTNVVITGMWKSAGTSYFPSLQEILITVGLTSFGILIYLFIAENFGVFTPHGHGAEDEDVSVRSGVGAGGVPTT
ncbi:MAG: hydrogenase [Syntrophorhabdus aromaticivorans]|uniref:Hydrogenase n=1 Tax=Syntrophorhabdus aromaticivorans TaxID=328301 RepID=A0A971S0G4_9BACT|nr:hydrogenase [Syntrophorhabdus aromaticivorans]